MKDEQTHLDVYIESYLSTDTAIKNTAIDKLTTFYISTVLDYVKEKHGIELAYKLAYDLAVWQQYKYEGY
jgi:hypothetical protein